MSDQNTQVKPLSSKDVFIQEREIEAITNAEINHIDNLIYLRQ